MNNSGESVRLLTRRYGIEAANPERTGAYVEELCRLCADSLSALGNADQRPIF